MLFIYMGLIICYKPPFMMEGKTKRSNAYFVSTARVGKVSEGEKA